MKLVSMISCDPLLGPWQGTAIRSIRREGPCLVNVKCVEMASYCGQCGHPNKEGPKLETDLLLGALP